MKRTLATLLVSLLALQASFAQPENLPTWTGVHNGPSNYYDEAGDIAIDSNDNLYVGGTSVAGSLGFAVVKYNPAGEEVGVFRHGTVYGKVVQLAVDQSNNIYAAGYRYLGSNMIEEILVKFDAAGVEQWTRPIPGRVIDVITDQAGGTYLAMRASNGYHTDWLLRRFAPDGTVKWDFRYDSGLGEDDILAGIVLLDDGSILSAGTSGDVHGKVLLTKHDLNGNLVFSTLTTHLVPTRRRSDITHNIAHGLGVSSSGEIFVLASMASSNSVYESAHQVWMRYSPTGQLLATRSGPALPNVRHATLLVDSGGNSYAATFTSLTKYTRTGSILWTYTYEPPTAGLGYRWLAEDSGGNILLVGTENTGTYNDNYLTMSLTTDGALDWYHRFEGAAGGNDRVAGIALDSTGSLFVTGTSWGGYGSIGGTYDDIVTLRYETR